MVLLVRKLDSEANLDDWRTLSEDTVARALVFNKKRCNEVAKLTIKAFQERPDFMGAELKDILQSLTPMEKLLCKRYVPIFEIPSFMNSFWSI